jgi:hypothetical protein
MVVVVAEAVVFLVMKVVWQIVRVTQDLFLFFSVWLGIRDCFVMHEIRMTRASSKKTSILNALTEEADFPIGPLVGDVVGDALKRQT